MRAKTSSTESSVVSIRTASGAARSGESSRVESRRSRSLMSASVSSKLCGRALALSSSKRRRARSSAAAVRKNFTSAEGKTTVPMSRPSRTTPPARPPPPHLALAATHLAPHSGDGRVDGGRAPDAIAANLRRHVAPVEHDAQRVRVAFETDQDAARDRGHAVCGRQVNARTGGGQRHGAVHRARVYVEQPQLAREPPAQG